MSRMYTVEFERQTVATASGDVDLFEFAPATNRPIELVGLLLSVTSELGDAAEEWIPYRVIRGHATTGNGTSTTPRPCDEFDAAAGFTAEVLGATIASAGTPVNLHSDAFNVRAGLQMWWPDNTGPKCTQSATLLVVRLMAAVTDDVTMSGVAYIREGN